MKAFVLRFSRYLVLPVLLCLGFVTGGVDGLVGWFVLGWLLWRAGPFMLGDIRTVFRWFFSAGSRLSLRGRRRSASSDLNV